MTPEQLTALKAYVRTAIAVRRSQFAATCREIRTSVESVGHLYQREYPSRLRTAAEREARERVRIAANAMEKASGTPTDAQSLEALLRDELEIQGDDYSTAFQDVLDSLNPFAELLTSVNRRDDGIVPVFRGQAKTWISEEIAAAAAEGALRATFQPRTGGSETIAEGCKRIFLGFPFAIPEIRKAVERAADGIAKVIVASDVLRGKPLLHKIDEMMREADLSLFDLTLHNPNVAVELGIAFGRSYKLAILYCTDEQLNPRPETESSVFSDLKGWDSVLYHDLAELEAKLRPYLLELLSVDAPLIERP
jgi:hypothetical protein